MDERADELAAWSGRDLFDANRTKIGTITGLGFSRRKFGSWWLSVESVSGKSLIVPVEPITSSGERIVLPYVKGYVESGPALEQGRPFTKEDERRLALHYGFSHRTPGSECLRGCGLCMAGRRAERHRKSVASPRPAAH
jgi:hypothetical protein